ncbi:MAG: (d)CMP kinase [Pikeienuella sp.]
MNESPKTFTVAIDGPAAAGKGTISKAIAAKFGFAHLDTGLLYRAVGAVSAETGRDPAEVAAGLSDTDLARDDLRSAPAAQAASKVAVIPEVRAALVEFQRNFATRPGGAVLDGRDIGTVICPDAEVKFYVTASAEERARRRHAELVAKGDDITAAEVLADVIARDERDANRAEAPMKPADEAYLLDTTNLAIDAAVAEATRWINEQLPKARA